MRVLIVDDSKANRNIARVLLENSGHHVTEAEGGLESVQLATKERFDVLLMDIAMPEMDGLAATRAIRALEGPMSRVPIIAWTAHDVPGMRGQTRAAGMNAYLTKPIVRATLLSTIGAFDLGAGLQQFEASGSTASAPI
jgi:two-component system sensor histidine kinase/response regulator